MVEKSPPIIYLKPADIQVLTRDEFIGLYHLPDNITVPKKPFFIRVDCQDGVKCDCGECPNYSGSAFVPCDSKDEAELRQKLIWNYLAVRRVRGRAHEADAMLRGLTMWA